MALIHWEPVREINSLQSEVNRLFDTFFAPSSQGQAAAAPRRWVPAMDLVEREGEYVLRADLPGLNQQDVRIDYENRVLTISGERRVEHERGGEGYYRIERAFGAFSRSLTLPDGVEPGRIAATFSNGVLEVTIPKPEARRPHRVAIEVGGEQPSVEATAREADAGAPAGVEAEPEPALAGSTNGHAA